MSRKVSAFNLKTAADIDTAADYFPFIDASASDANKNSRTIFDELRKAPGIGDLLSGNKITGTLVTQKKEYQALAGSATQAILDYSASGYVNSLFLGISYSDVNSAYGKYQHLSRRFAYADDIDANDPVLSCSLGARCGNAQ